ncbi:cell division protein FtsB [Spiribacter sp. C176]|uniref:Cell division protein FtsB n=1 Tax=Spiribacter salilacus TaxID=2664894 RepID=A0A6N7QSE0_9GAMM|nr:cell division protein FtsB [Spiribacter salilacus]MRH77227.1 cell division protein FtsB [Spiribacter salilacus]
MRWLAAGLLLLVLLLQSRLWFGDGSIPNAWRLQQAVSAQEAENARLDERNQALSADVADLRDGLSGIEERARLELGLVGEEEQFFQVIEPREDP